MNNRLINTKVAGGGGCTDIVDNYDPFGGNGVALYQLNGDATDVSGNYNGTATNVTYGTGVFGQAGVFNGSNSSIELPIVGASTGVVTYSLWTKLTVTQTFNTLISVGTVSTQLRQILFYQPTNLIQAQVRDGSDSSIILSFDATSLLSEYVHIAFTQNGANIALYVNGVLRDSTTMTGFRNSYAGSHFIGKRASNNDQYINASIDQVRIFNTALTPLEVEALYTEELCICDGTVDTLDILGDGSCIATYQLDGNANDLSGNYSGTPTNVSYGVGEFDLAGVFNGTSSYIDSNIKLNSNIGTVSLWVKTTSTWACFFGANGNSLTNRFYLGVRDSNFWLGTGTTQTYTVNASALLDNNWHNVVLTLNGSIAKYYLDGQEVDSQNYTSGGSLDINAYIGALNSGNAQFFLDGSIDQVRIFNKALSAGEVTTLYNETACTKAACTGTTNTLDILGDGSCVAAYPLDGSPADLSGNYNGVQTDVTYPQGYFDLAGSFNGGTSIIRNSDLGVAFRGQTELSLSCWFRTNQSVSLQSLFGFSTTGDASTELFINIRADEGNALGFINRNDGTGIVEVRASGSGSVIDNNWHNVVFTANSSGTKLYLDGSELTNMTYRTGSSSTQISMPSDLNQFNIGGSQDSTGIEFLYNGSIDQVRIFNKALSAGEVTTLYNETPCN